MTDRRAAALALGVLAAVTLFLFWPLFAGLLTGAPRFFEWDVPEQYWPDLVALCRSMHSFDLPLWNPWDRGGYPMYADPQAGLYHPLNHAICAIAGADPGPAWAIARVPLGFFAAGAFGLAWLRRLRLGWGPALLGAAVIQTAPFMRHNWELNLTAALAWMPAMLWAAEGLATRRRLRDAAALALATGLCVQVGSPPAAWQAGTYTLGYLLFRLAVELRAHGREAVLRPMVTSVAWAAPATMVQGSVRIWLSQLAHWMTETAMAPFALASIASITSRSRKALARPPVCRRNSRSLTL